MDSTQHASRESKTRRDSLTRHLTTQLRRPPTRLQIRSPIASIWFLAPPSPPSASLRSQAMLPSVSIPLISLSLARRSGWRGGLWLRPWARHGQQVWTRRNIRHVSWRPDITC